MKIAISPTTIKVQAAKNAAIRASRDLGIPIEIIESVHKFDSGVPPQPFNPVEAHQGARKRAQDVLNAPDAKEATHALGIENGAMDLGMVKYADPAIVVLLDRSGEWTVIPSLGFPMPVKELGMSLQSEQKQTAGNFIAKRIGGDHANWQSTSSGGLLPRDKNIEDAVYAAIVYMLSPVK